MKMRKIHYTVLFVIGLSIFVSGCREKSEVEKTEWFQYALKFDQAKSKMITNEVAGKKSAFKDINKMSELKQRFLHSKQPTEAEIISVLRSPNREFQRVGLTAMCLKPIETDQTIDILFEFLKDQDREFRWYAVACLEDFTKFPESKKESLGRQLFVINKSEKNEELFIRMFCLFAKFPRQEAVPLLTEQLMKEGKENRIYRFFAFKTLKEMGDSYFNQAAEYVNKHGSTEIKTEFSEQREQWKKNNDKK